MALYIKGNSSMHKKIMWSLVCLATISSLWAIYHYFEKAFPFVHVSISITAKQAEDEARAISKQLGWGLQDYDCAVQFEDDGRLQAFVELEGGGKQAFIDMIDRNYYQPYEWCVRFFKEKEIHETKIWFTPSGKKNGFKQTLPEDQPGNNLSEAAALKIAESAVQDWGYDLTPYNLVEHDEKVQPSKRLDHTFMYERSDISLNKGLYRLKVVVSGDQVTGVSLAVKIPDEFNRRYAQMSSANTLIASLAKGIAILLYLFVFGLFGLFILYRKRYILVNHAIKILLIAVVLGFATWINWLPLVWNYYVTTTSKTVFMIQIFGSMVLSVMMVGICLAIFFCMAESFDRYVFGRHIQFFKLWTRNVASSCYVLEQTLLGYCMAIIGIGYIVGFYMLATSWGWWYPLQTNFDPNSLSTHVPFLSPCLRALAAGFWEELVFRVLPIAGILLLTRNSKHQRYWLIGMIVVQAIIFGAGHAMYPQQPAYFRIVEMFLEFMLYGCCYYVFGLLPCIVAHFAYDALLMCTPIFTSTLLLQKGLALLFIGIPLWVVLIRWVQQGYRWSIVPEGAYNKAWVSPAVEVEEEPINRDLGSLISNSAKKYAYVFGAIGLLLFLNSREFKFNTPAIKVSQDYAKDVAKKAVFDRFGDIGTDWNVLVNFATAVTDNDNKFIWQQYGDKEYAALEGSYVDSANYVVRFVKFVGPVEQRAEEYGVDVSCDGKVLSLIHKLPEAQPGADISEHQAKDMAYTFVHEAYGLEHDDVEMVSCDSTKHEFRRDWTVVLRDIKNYQQDKGQAHIRIIMSGDEIAGYARFIDAPEEWKRAEQERLIKKGLLGQVCFLGYLLLLLYFASIAFKKIGLHLFVLRVVGGIAGVAFIIKVLMIANEWDVMLFSLSSAQPIFHQIQRWLMMHTVSAIGQSLIGASLLVLALWSAKKGLIIQLRSLIIPACALACGIVGIFSVVTIMEPVLHAQAPLYCFVSSKNSLFSMLVYILCGVVGQFLCIVATWMIARCYKSVAIQLALFSVAGICLWGINGGWEVMWACILLGITWGCVWYVLCCYFYAKNIEILLITLTVTQCLHLVPSAWYHAYPMIMFDVMVSAIILIPVSIWACKKLQAVE